jgi:hypothetical protein
VRRGKEGGLAVSHMDVSGTIGSALLYLNFAGIDPAGTRALLGQFRSAGTTRGANPALALFERVLEACSGPPSGAAPA